MNKDRALHALRNANPVVLRHGVARYFILWLSCGHSGGVGKAGDSVVRKKCHTCNGWKHVVRAEPRNE